MPERRCSGCTPLPRIDPLLFSSLFFFDVTLGCSHLNVMCSQETNAVFAQASEGLEKQLAARQAIGLGRGFPLTVRVRKQLATRQWGISSANDHKPPRDRRT